ncbi:hypothetical protein ACFVFH_23420 [Streptomyces sp. NPDC057697]
MKRADDVFAFNRTVDAAVAAHDGDHRISDGIASSRVKREP